MSKVLIGFVGGCMSVLQGTIGTVEVDEGDECWGGGQGDMGAWWPWGDGFLEAWRGGGPCTSALPLDLLATKQTAVIHAGKKRGQGTGGGSLKEDASSHLDADKGGVRARGKGGRRGGTWKRIDCLTWISSQPAAACSILTVLPPDPMTCPILSGSMVNLLILGAYWDSCLAGGGLHAPISRRMCCLPTLACSRACSITARVIPST